MSNIILLCAITGVILLILRRLPEAVAIHKQELESRRPVDGALIVPDSVSLRIYYRSRAFVLYWSRRAWNFALEAKGLRPPSLGNYRIKKIFRNRRNNSSATIHTSPVAVNMNDVSPVSSQQVQDERYYLEKIKEQPHDLALYNSLGQFYFSTGNFTDAQNVYEYLINRDATSGTYYAKLAYCKLNLKFYEEAATLYEKSLALDSGHPNRYYNLALTYKILDQTDNAARAIRKALELEPHNSKYKDLLGSM